MQFAPLYPLIYPILKTAFPDCLWSGVTQSRAIALTYDDGPHPDYTPQLLQVLDHYGIKASFFWLGTCVNQTPETARAVYARGHWIGLHGYDHQSFPLLTPHQLKQSLEKTQLAIQNALGGLTPGENVLGIGNTPLSPLQPEHLRDVRPPNGLFTPRTLRLLQQWEYRPVMWSVVPEDWVRPGVSVIVQRVLQQVQNGSLIVLHDGYYGGQEVAQVTAALIPRLLDKGYQFVTIKQLWQHKHQ